MYLCADYQFYLLELNKSNIHRKEETNMQDTNRTDLQENEELEVEGYDDCGSSTAIYECKDDCIIIGGPLISRIH